jgi:hypothetical protein
VSIAVTNELWALRKKGGWGKGVSGAQQRSANHENPRARSLAHSGKPREPQRLKPMAALLRGAEAPLFHGLAGRACTLKNQDQDQRQPTRGSAPHERGPNRHEWSSCAFPLLPNSGTSVAKAVSERALTQRLEVLLHSKPAFFRAHFEPRSVTTP